MRLVKVDLQLSVHSEIAEQIDEISFRPAAAGVQRFRKPVILHSAQSSQLVRALLRNFSEAEQVRLLARWQLLERAHSGVEDVSLQSLQIAGESL